MIRMWLIRRLGVSECGAFGGVVTNPFDRTQSLQRWCRKPFGHTDSCAFDTAPDLPTSQPGCELRQRAKGWVVSDD